MRRIHVRMWVAFKRNIKNHIQKSLKTHSFVEWHRVQVMPPQQRKGEHTHTKTHINACNLCANTHSRHYTRFNFENVEYISLSAKPHACMHKQSAHIQTATAIPFIGTDKLRVRCRRRRCCRPSDVHVALPPKSVVSSQHLWPREYSELALLSLRLAGAHCTIFKQTAHANCAHTQISECVFPPKGNDAPTMRPTNTRTRRARDTTKPSEADGNDFHILSRPLGLSSLACGAWHVRQTRPAAECAKSKTQTHSHTYKHIYFSRVVFGRCVRFRCAACTTWPSRHFFSSAEPGAAIKPDIL